MPDQHELRKYYQDPACSICGRKIKGWAKAKCDNCQAVVCNRHRPMFVSQWHCPKCKMRQNNFTTQFAPAPLSAVTAQIEDLLFLNRTAEAEALSLRAAEEILAEN